MQFVYHLGVHCTDEERLVRTLLRNRGALLPLGTAVPAPGRYRPVIRDTIASLRGANASPEAQDALLDVVLDGDDPRRVFFSNEYFLGMPIRAISESSLYHIIGRRAAALAGLFPDARNEFLVAIRNPATLIPALIARTPGATYDGIMGDTDPTALRWTAVIRRLAAQVPEARIVVWCNEDLPVIWPEVLRVAAGVPDDLPLEGEYDMTQAVMTPAGFAKLTEFLATHPPRSASARRKILMAFLERYASPDALEMEVPLPGWTPALVDRITAGYDADCEELRYMKRIEMILP